MTHYFMKFNYQNYAAPKLVQHALSGLKGTYEVIEANGSNDLVYASFASIRKDVSVPFAGSTYLNPKDANNSAFGKKLAFKRAVKALLLSHGDYLPKEELTIFCRSAESEFRRLRSINEVVMEETYE
jgi:hypothetical protein